MALDAGLVLDSAAVWREVLEDVKMEPVWTDEVYEIIERAFRKRPELPLKFTIFQEVLEERERVAWEGGQDAGQRLGEVSYAHSSLLRLLRRKFGELPAEVVQRVEATEELSILNEWLDRQVDARSLAEMGLEQGASNGTQVGSI